MPNKMFPYLERASLINQYGTKFPAGEILKDQQIILLYFSSNKDTDVELMELVRKVYEKVAEHSLRCEIVMVPVDVQEQHSKECFAKHGNWYSLPHNCITISELVVIYNIIGTPTISVIKPDGSLISRRGEDDLRQYGSHALMAWS